MWVFDEVAEGRVGYTGTEMVNVLSDDPRKLKCMFIMG